MQLNISTFSALASNISIPANSQLNGASFSGSGSGKCFLPFSKNVLVKKINLIYQPNSITANPIKFWSVRMKVLNEDGSLYRGLQGETINPTSGAFNPFPTKINLLELFFTSDNPILDFKEGILIGGMQWDDVMFEWYNLNAVNAINMLMIVYWQFPE